MVRRHPAKGSCPIFMVPRNQDSSAEENNGGQEDGRTEDVGAAAVAGCNAPPVLQSGKKILDFMTPAIEPLAVMDWFLATATGRNARRDALLGRHPTDFAPDPPSPLPQAAGLCAPHRHW